MLFQRISFCQTFVLKCFKHFFKYPLTSNAFTVYTIYYSIVDINEEVGILGALQAIYFKNSAYK